MPTKRLDHPMVRLSFLAAAILILSTVVIITVAHQRQQAVRRQLELFITLDTIERTVTDMERAIAGRDVAEVMRLRSIAQGGLDEVDRTAADLSSLDDARINERLLALQSILGRVRSHASAGEGRVSWELLSAEMFPLTRGIEALNVELSDAFAKDSAAYGALWIKLDALIAASALFFLVLLVHQIRSARVQARLYNELRALTEGTPQVLVSIDESGTPVRWNERLLRATGLQPEVLRTMRITDLFDQDARGAVVQALDDALTTGLCEREIPLRCGGKPVEFSWVFSVNERGDDDGMIVTISGRDISDRMAAQRLLQVTELRYRELFEQIHDAVYISEAGLIVAANTAATRLLGYTREELIGLPVLALYEHVADREAYVSEVERNGGAVAEYPVRLRRKDGAVLDCLVTSVQRVDASGRIIGFQGIIRDVSERQRFEDALRQSERDHRGLFENAREAILILDIEKETVLDANAAACEMYEFTYEQFVGLSMIDLSVDPVRGREYVAQTLEGTGYRSFESRQMRRDGLIMDVEIRAAVVSYKNGKAIMSINRDVTARNEAERRVRESEERFRLLLESVTDYAIYMLDPAGRIVSWNEGAERITGFSDAEIVGQSFAQLFSPELVEQCVPHRELDVAAATGRSESEDWLVRKDGTRFQATVTLTRVVDETGWLRGFAQVTRDITDRKALEQSEHELLDALQSIAQEWTKTFDAVSTPILMLDAESRIRRLNRAAQSLAGAPFASILGRRVSELPGEPWEAITRIAQFHGEHGATTESRAEDPQTRRVFQVEATAVDLESESRLIFTAHELTLLTQLEESLRQAEIAAALGAVVGGVAHEVRNPLFTISAILDTWEAKMGKTPELRHYLDPLREEIGRLNSLMHDLLEYGKPHQLDLQPVSIASILRAAISQNRSAIAGKQIEVACAIANDLPLAFADETRMQQVFRNVIENAVQHSPAKSRIDVSVSEEALGLKCEVRDSGRGLSPDDLHRAFAPFYTRRPGGTGLGLAIARKVVLAHGGEIYLQNREEGGVIATILLPSAPAVPVAATAAI